MDSYFGNKKKRPFSVRLIWGIFILLTVVSSVALVLAWLAAWLDPYYFWYVAFLGLATPILILINTICLLVLGLKLSKWAFVPMAALIIGFGFIGDFIQVRYVTEYKPEQKKRPKDELTVMTYNVHSFMQYGDRSVVTIDDIISYITIVDPDVVCIQEFQLRNEKDGKKFEDRLSEWKYQVQSNVIESGEYSWGLAILSKFPLKDARAVKFKDRTNSAMFADVLIGNDTVRLFNAHLQSTQFNKLSRRKLQEENAETAARLVGSTLRQNYKVRAFQADSIASIIASSPYPAIVTGDFNDTPMSYVYHTIRGDMKDTFREKGVGYEYTYIPFRKMFRIDYILHSEIIETLSHETPLVGWSDHKPVISRLKVKTKGN